MDQKRKQWKCNIKKIVDLSTSLQNCTIQYRQLELEIEYHEKEFYDESIHGKRECDLKY